ncbi:hypothetical protein ACME84_15265 [Enterobacter hormaechei]
MRNFTGIDSVYEAPESLRFICKVNNW